MKKVFAFDVDGTLTSSKMNIQEGVKSFFADKRLKENVVLFATGNTITTVSSVRKKLLPYLKDLDSISSYATTLGGSIIYDKNNNILYERFLCRKKLKNYLTLAEQVDPNCVFMFMNKQQQVFNHITTEEIKNMIDNNLEKMGMAENEIKFDNKPYLSLLKKLPRIYSTAIFSLKHSKQIYEALLPLCQEAGFSIYHSKKSGMVQISAGSKLRALKYIAKLLKNDGVFDGTVKDFVYFGDEGNDIDCMRTCKLSVARGKDLEQEVINSCNIYTEDLTPYLNTIFE